MESFQYMAWLLILLPFWLFAQLLKKRKGTQRGYGDDNPPPADGWGQAV